jgi:hypothetical protein
MYTHQFLAVVHESLEHILSQRSREDKVECDWVPPWIVRMGKTPINFTGRRQFKTPDRIEANNCRSPQEKLFPRAATDEDMEIM